MMFEPMSLFGKEHSDLSLSLGIWHGRSKGEIPQAEHHHFNGGKLLRTSALIGDCPPNGSESQ